MAEPTLRDFLDEGPFTLSLSAGFFGFYAHLGLVTALAEKDLLPARLTGSSAGGLVAGVWASGLDLEVFRRLLFELKREDFWDPGLGLGLLRGQLFRELLETHLPVEEIEACWAPLSLSTFDVVRRRTRVLDAGPLAPAIQASCAVPVLFQPVRLRGLLLSDGGHDDRAALASVAEGERVLSHFIVSRSPWRRRWSRVHDVPERRSGVTLVIDGLPWVDPFRLDAGRDAFEAGRKSMEAALARPAAGVVHV